MKDFLRYTNIIFILELVLKLWLILLIELLIIILFKFKIFYSWTLTVFRKYSLKRAPEELLNLNLIVRLES